MRSIPGHWCHRDGIPRRSGTQQLPVKDEDRLKPAIVLFEKDKKKVKRGERTPTSMHVIADMYRPPL
jgi:hypothetical protein